MPTSTTSAAFKFNKRTLLLELHNVVNGLAKPMMQQNTNLTYKQCEIVAIDLLIRILTEVRDGSGVLVQTEEISTLDARNVKEWKQ